MNVNFLRGPGNISLDLARIIGASAAALYPFPYIWNCIKHGTVPDPASWGQGYGLVLAGIGALICAKDIGVAKANASCGGSDAA